MLSIFTKLKRNIKSSRLKNRKSKTKIFSSKHSSSGKVEKGNKSILLKISVIIVLVVGIFVWFGYSIYKFICSNFELAYRDKQMEQIYNWRGEGRLNILLLGLDKRDGEYGFVDAVLLVMLDPVENSIGIFNINTDTTVYISKYNRNVKIKNLYNYGILEADEVPVKLFVDNVENLVSIKINKYVIVDEEGLVSISEALGGIYVHNGSDLEDVDIKTSSGSYKLSSGSYRLKGDDFLHFVRADDDGLDAKFIRQNEGMESLLKRLSGYMIVIKGPMLLDALTSNIKTNLTKNEMIRIVYEISKFKEVRTAYMSENVMEAVKTDNDISYYPIYDYLDQEIQKVFVDNLVGKEQARVEIFNSTSIKGLAAFRARWLRNIGIDVIRVGDCSDEFEKTTIFTREEKKYNNTIEAVKKSFSEETIIKEGELPSWVCTGDVIIVLGSNIVTE